MRIDEQTLLEEWKTGLEKVAGSHLYRVRLNGHRTMYKIAQYGTVSGRRRVGLVTMAGK